MFYGTFLTASLCALDSYATTVIFTVAFLPLPSAAVQTIAGLVGSGHDFYTIRGAVYIGVITGHIPVKRLIHDTVNGQPGQGGVILGTELIIGIYLAAALGKKVDVSILWFKSNLSQTAHVISCSKTKNPNPFPMGNKLGFSCIVNDVGLDYIMVRPALNRRAATVHRTVAFR